MIKALVLDIDGVIVGGTTGVNFPLPHPEVLAALKKIRASGIPICLCTAKPYFAILDIIKSAGLDNPHITEGGSVLINPIDATITQKHTIDLALAVEIIEHYINHGVYVELYTIDRYFIQKDQRCVITEQHTSILGRPPELVASLVAQARESEIVKIMPIARDEVDKQRLTELFESFKDTLTLNWGVHPAVMPLQFGIVTAPGISKERAAEAITDYLHIPLADTLGVGDSMSDWQFIKLCGYGAAMGNASAELKQLVLSKGTAHSFIAPSVEENGVLKVFDYFTKQLLLNKKP